MKTGSGQPEVGLKTGSDQPETGIKPEVNNRKQAVNTEFFEFKPIFWVGDVWTVCKQRN